MINVMLELVLQWMIVHACTIWKNVCHLFFERAPSKKKNTIKSATLPSLQLLGYTLYMWKTVRISNRILAVVILDAQSTEILSY